MIVCGILAACESPAVCADAGATTWLDVEVGADCEEHTVDPPIDESAVCPDDVVLIGARLRVRSPAAGGTLSIIGVGSTPVERCVARIDACDGACAAAVCGSVTDRSALILDLDRTDETFLLRGQQIVQICPP